MSKRKPLYKPPASSSAAFKQNGLKAFRRNDFNLAIAQWSRLKLETDPAVRSALAEAYFRRALAGGPAEQRLADLAQAVDLMPDEGRYWYHFGLAQHRARQLDSAIAAYTRAAEAGFSRSALNFTRSLAELERNPRVDLATLPGLSTTDRTSLAPIAALLRDDPQAVLAALGTPAEVGTAQAEAQRTGQANESIGKLWHGLALLAARQLQPALAALAPAGHALNAGAEATRATYHGLVLAALGDRAAALSEWSTAVARTPTPHLQSLVAQAQAHDAQAALKNEQWADVLTAVQTAFKVMPGHPLLIRMALVARNRLAQAAAARGEWPAAIGHWQQMLFDLSTQPDLGPAAPILHNLAVAQEKAAHWEDAAEAWGALLDKLPRRATKKSQAGLPLPLPEFRGWLRRRMLDNYQRAGRPDLAIAHYRSLIKANPDDLELRLGLADALVANEQLIAGRNELQRILDRDESYLDARVQLAELHLERGEFYAAEQQLRRAVEIEPRHVPSRRGLAKVLSQRGHGQFNIGLLEQAKALYAEALQFTPDDDDVLIWLGNTELALHDLAQAQRHFEAALAKGDLHTYVGVLGCWVQHGSVNEARQLLERAETAGVASPHFYIEAAGECFKANQSMLPPPFYTPRGPKKTANVWDQLGHELLKKFDAAGGDRPEMLRHAIAALGPAQPELALVYAQKLARLTPDDPIALMQLGLLQGLSGQTKVAKQTLHQAARLARKQGNAGVLDEIEHVRQMIDDPFMGMLPNLDLPFDDFDDEDLF